MSKRILMLCTSHDRMTPETRTGLWLEEFVVPFLIFQKAGATISVASSAGGEVPIDARSITGVDTKENAKIIALLLDSKAVKDLSHDDFDAVFIPGGHGPVFDLASDKASSALVSAIAKNDGTVGAVCHGPAALVGVVGADGKPIVAGRKVTGFSNAEEDQTGVGPALPFLLQSKFEEQGGQYSCAQPWQAHVVTDGKLVTGQNPASSAGTADAMLAVLG